MISVGIKRKLPRNIGYQCKGNDYLRLENNCQDQCTSWDPRAEPKQSRLKMPAVAKTLLAVRKLKKFPGGEPTFHNVWNEESFWFSGHLRAICGNRFVLFIPLSLCRGLILVSSPTAISKIICPGALVQIRPSGWTETAQLIKRIWNLCVIQTKCL